jgi:spore germination protein KC
MGKYFLIFLILFSTPVLSGCWDYIDIESRANVLGVAIDTASHEEVEQEGEITHSKDIKIKQQDPIRITVQIAIPGKIPLGTGGQQGEGGKGTVWVLDVAGRTFDDAWENLQQQLSLRLSLGHLRVIIVSEEVAKKGLRELNDFLRRNHEVRRAAWLVVSKENAAKHMEAAPSLERIPSLYLVTAIDEAIKLGKFPEDFLGVFWSKTSSLGQDPILPYITLKDKGNIEISGMALFRDDRMVGASKPLDIGRYMAMMQINPGGYSALVSIPEEEAAIMFQSDERKSKINVNIKNGLPHVQIKVHIEGELEEKINQQFDLTPKTIKKVEEMVQEGTIQSFIDFVKTTQNQQADIFGFGEYVRAKHPHFWKENIKTKEKWQEMYKDIPVDIEVTISIRRVGMKNK